MTYLTTSLHDHGNIGFGCFSYGGLAYRPSAICQPSTSKKTEFGFIDDESVSESTSSAANGTVPRFVTEHNLALYWRRPGLFPRTGGFPIPLLETCDDYSNGIRNRPPGNLRPDSAPIRYRQRNLLAGELSKTSGDILKLWAVNDFSDHKLLLQYSLALEDSSRCQKNRILRAFEIADDKRQLALPCEALELRAYTSSQLEGKIFIRTKRSLLMADMHEERDGTISTVFASSPQCFIQIPYMEGEIAAVDAAGFIFWGSLGNTLSRAKASLLIKEVCATDNPRVLMAIGEKDLVQKDLRIGDNYSQVVYSHNPEKLSNLILPEEAYARRLSKVVLDYIESRERFCHVNSIDVQLETVVLTTTRQHLLIDKRMTNKALLFMSHSELDGSDYCLTTPAFRDPESGGRVFSLYSLTQVRRPALSHWSFMFHPKENLWSSLGSKYELDSPQIDICKYIGSHARISPIESSQLPKFTRAIYYQPLPEQSSRALLFRQMDGGEIWYENVIFDPVPMIEAETPSAISSVSETPMERKMKDFQMEEVDSESQPTPICQQALKKQSIKYIRRYLRERQGATSSSAYVQGVESEYLMPPSSVLNKIVSNIGEIDLSRFPDTNEVPENADPFQGIGELEPVPTSQLGNFKLVTKVENGDRLLSSIILNMWSKASDYHKHNTSALGRPLAREYLQDEWDAEPEISKKVKRAF